MELNLFDGQKDLSEKEIKERYNSHMLAYLVSDYSTSLREIDDNFLEDLDVDEVVSEKDENKLKKIIQGELIKVANTDLLDFFTGEVEEKLIKNVPEKYKLHAHHWLIILGRYTCLARKPMCFKCPVVTYCSYKQKVLEHD